MSNITVYRNKPAIVHYQTGRGTFCSLDNDASIRTPTEDKATVTCPHCLKLLALNLRPREQAGEITTWEQTELF